MFAVNDISVSFGETVILKNVSFAIPLGSTVGIIGPNGSGKTTLFNAISGFVKTESGVITVDGADLSRLAPYARARQGISRVFQNPGIFRHLTVLENITLAITAKQRSWEAFVPSFRQNTQNTEQAMHYLSVVGLQVKKTQKAGALSGGQMRLLEMARALASDAKVYLLDEPTAGVSPRLKDEVSAAISQLIGLKRVVLVIEHDMNFIRSFVDRIIVLDQGSIFMDDTPAEVMRSPQLKEIYFGSAVA